MAYSTVYDVRVRYSVDNRAGRTGTQGLTDDVRKLGTEAKRTTGIFGRLGVAVVGAFGARAAGKALIGFNATVEDTKNQIAGMLALTKKTDLVDQVATADRLYKNLQKRAASLPGTTAEYAQMLGMLTQPITNAGGTLKDLEDLTVNAVVGAKALGVSWDVAARDIDQALRGQFHSVDQFTGKILGSMGFTGEEGRKKFNEMNQGARMDTLRAALMQKQLTQLAAAQGNTFAGSLSTLQDSIEQFLGKVGVPLFRAITAEIKSWNKWIDANGRKVDEIASKLGAGLVDGFRFVKDALSFLVDHADMLIMIGKVWAGVKLGGMLSSGLASLGGGGAGALSGLFGGGAWGGQAGFFRGARDRFNPETGEYEFTKAGRGRQAVGGLKGAMENAGLLGQAAGVGFAIGSIINNATGLSRSLSGAVEVNGKLYDASDRTTRQFIKLEREGARLEESLRRAADANPKGPTAIRNLQGQALDYRQQANLVRDAFAAYQTAQRTGSFADQAEFMRRKQIAEEAGLSMSDIMKAGGPQSFITSMQAKAGALDARTTGAGLGTVAAMTLGVAKLTEYQRKTLETELAQEEISRYMVQQLASGKLINPDTVMEILRRNTADPEGKHKNVADKPKVNVTIQRIEVQSDDPDRMAFGLVESFRDAAKNPSGALAALREG